ncbi:aminotransferase class I/II-fold pyridoxal phosphate-dependent enzyme [Kiloniella laminariae]|uniref:aminotransferase class I/II-fold pyridoxal phosphate-dependent enzyme n=1 Tax=Kiloniella laminariae TaxID=454162 RepID=UPI0003728519|nr:aminotransferase class I/II-fold pyridoxal phosphate-dependent enzyme [Kiloniella laminariae]
MRDFTLETFFSKWEFAARYHMTASDMQSMSVSELLALASDEDRTAFDKLHLGYTETWGAPDLRAEIARTYERAEPDDILCFAGAEEGIYIAMKVLLEPSDHAIVVVPNYQAAETLPLSICAVSGVALNAEDNWSLDIDAVRAAIRPNTKLISINFPNNPTGAVLERSRFDALVELCREQGIWLFSDEVYRGVEREESLRLPQAGDVYERGLSLNVMSKAYGLPGLRIGWIMTRDREIRSRMERYKHYLSICNSAPSERLSLIALKARDQILTRNRALLAENAVKLGSFFAEFPDLFDWRQPEGGCVGYPCYKGPGSTDEFCEKLVRESGVLLLPPHIYHSELLPTPSDRFRVGFGRANIDEGLSAFRAWLRRNG